MHLQVPGFNAPAVEMGSVVIGPGDVLFSPKGNIHYFVRETNVTDAFDIHVSGYAAPFVSPRTPCKGRRSPRRTFRHGAGIRCCMCCLQSKPAW